MEQDNIRPICLGIRWRGILPLKDPLESGNANFSLVGQKYFKIDIVPKTRAKLTRAYTIFSYW